MWLVWTLLIVVSKSLSGPSEKGENKCPVAEAEAVTSSEAFLLDLVLWRLEIPLTLHKITTGENCSLRKEFFFTFLIVSFISNCTGKDDHKYCHERVIFLFMLVSSLLSCRIAR
jgi:hypothetical protein